MFYKDYFAEGKPAYVPKKFVAPARRPRRGPGDGGAPVLSHPGAYFQRTTAEDARALKAHGLARPGGLHVLSHGRADRLLPGAGRGARSRGHGRLGFPRPDQAPRRTSAPCGKGTTAWSRSSGREGEAGHELARLGSCWPSSSSRPSSASSRASSGRPSASSPSSPGSSWPSSTTSRRRASSRPSSRTGCSATSWASSSSSSSSSSPGPSSAISSPRP